jgi:hypothetical protein
MAALARHTLRTPLAEAASGAKQSRQGRNCIEVEIKAEGIDFRPVAAVSPERRQAFTATENPVTNKRLHRRHAQRAGLS